jgi:hypothetical protein
MAPRAVPRGATVNRVTYLPDGTSTFDLAMDILKILHQGYGAVVTDVDLVSDGMRFDLELSRPPRWLQLRARREALEAARQRAKKRERYCLDLRERLHRQSWWLEQERLWLASTAR